MYVLTFNAQKSAERRLCHVDVLQLDLDVVRVLV